jgi:hypothetical protein
MVVMFGKKNQRRGFKPPKIASSAVIMGLVLLVVSYLIISNSGIHTWFESSTKTGDVVVLALPSSNFTVYPATPYMITNSVNVSLHKFYKTLTTSSTIYYHADTVVVNGDKCVRFRLFNEVKDGYYFSTEVLVNVDKAFDSNYTTNVKLNDVFVDGKYLKASVTITQKYVPTWVIVIFMLIFYVSILKLLKDNPEDKGMVYFIFSLIVFFLLILGPGVNAMVGFVSITFILAILAIMAFYH